MAADVDVRVIKKTQDTLGTVIKKPPLNEKLLKKPPFRFLHDIVTNVITHTGFFEGLYSAEDLVSENVKEKDNKVIFLQKAIDVVAMVTGEALSARPSKIVAGQEPAKTNEFLQALAKALIHKKSSTDAVQRVLNGEKPSVGEKKTTKGPSQRKDGSVDRKPKGASTRPEKPTKEAANKTGRDSNKLTKDSSKSSKDASKANKPVTKDTTKTSRDASKTSKDETKVSKKPKDEPKTPKSPKSESNVKREAVLVNSPSKEEIPVLAIESEEPVTNSNQDHFISEAIATPPPPTPKPEPEQIRSPALLSDTETKPDSPAKSVRPAFSARPSAPSRQSRQRSNHVSAKIKAEIPAEPPPPQQTPIENKIDSTSFSGDPIPRPQSVMRARSARPTTARPAPPRIINRNLVNPEEASRTPSAKPVTNLILDTDTKENEDDDEGFIVEDKAVAESELPFVPATEATATSGLDTTEGVQTAEEETTQQGSLVRQMLQTKKGLEGGSQATRKGEADSSELGEVKQQSALQRETTSKELEQLRQFIQTVSRSANPLGKMLDYLQEDIDSMNMELRMWKEEHRNNLVALRREEGVTEDLLDPLSKQLEDLEQAVQDQGDQISALKATVLYNDQRIHKLLTSTHKA